MYQKFVDVINRNLYIFKINSRVSYISESLSRIVLVTATGLKPRTTQFVNKHSTIWLSCPVFLSLFRYYIVFCRSIRITCFSKSIALHISNILLCRMVESFLFVFLFYSKICRCLLDSCGMTYIQVYTFYSTQKFCKRLFI